MISSNSGMPRLTPRAGDRFGDYEIIRRVGAGGMGVVYLARQISSSQQVALKILSPLVTRDKIRRRFFREAQAVSRLRHPNIVEVYGTHEDQDVCFYVMEYIDGWPLSRVINRLNKAGPPFPAVTAIMKMDSGDDDEEESHEATTLPNLLRKTTPPGEALPIRAGRSARRSDSETLEPPVQAITSDLWYIRQVAVMIRDVAYALAYAHANGIVHRDVKPDNLLLDHTGLLHIVDFGLARVLDQQSITLSGELMGTPLYMSPEQVAAGRIGIDHRTDIYSLGVVMYHLLCLKPPFEAETREGLLRAIAMQPAPQLTGKNPNVPRPLETIVHKTMEKDPEHRYESGGELAADLDRWLSGSPIQARRTTQVRRWWTAQPKTLRRMIIGAGAVALSTLISAVSAIALLVQQKLPAHTVEPVLEQDPAPALAAALEAAETFDNTRAVLWHARSLEQGASVAGISTLHRSLTLNQLPRLHHRFPFLGPGPRFAFHPVRDLLLTAPSESELQMWNLQSPSPAGNPFGLGLFTRFLKFSGDGESLLTVSADLNSELVQVWNSAPRAVGSSPVSEQRVIRRISGSKDGRIFSFNSAADPGSLAYHVSVYHFRDHQPPALLTSADTMIPAELSSDGRFLATVNADHRLVLHNLIGPSIGSRIVEFQPELLAVSPASPLLAAADRSGAVTLISFLTGAPGSVRLRSPQAVQAGAATQSAARDASSGGSPIHMAFNADGSRLLVTQAAGMPSAHGSRRIRMWDIATGIMRFSALGRDARFTDAGNRLICWDENGVTIVNTIDGAVFSSISTPIRIGNDFLPDVPEDDSASRRPVWADRFGDHLTCIEPVASPGRYGPNRGWAGVWDVTTGERLYRLLTPVSNLTLAGLDATGDFAFVCAQSGTTWSDLMVWDLRDSRDSHPRLAVLPEAPATPSDVILSRRPFVATLARREDAYMRFVLDADSLQPISQPAASPERPAYWQISENGAARIELTLDSHAQLIDVSRGVNIDMWPLASRCAGVLAIAGMGNVVAIAHVDGSVSVRRIAPSARSTVQLAGIEPLTAAPTVMRFNYGGNLLAIGDAQGQVLLYNLGEHAEQLRTIITGAPIHDLCFCFNDRVMGVAHTAGRASLWSCSDGRQVAVIDPVAEGRRPVKQSSEETPTRMAVRDTPVQSALIATAAGSTIYLWLPPREDQTGERLAPAGPPLESTHDVLQLLFPFGSAEPVVQSAADRPVWLARPEVGGASDWLLALTGTRAVRWYNISNPYRSSQEWQRLILDATGMRLNASGEPVFVRQPEWLATRREISYSQRTAVTGP